MFGTGDLNSLGVANIAQEMAHDITTILHYGRSMPRPLTKPSAASTNYPTAATTSEANNNTTHHHQNQQTQSQEKEKFYSNERDAILNELLHEINQTVQPAVSSNKPQANLANHSSHVSSSKSRESEVIMASLYFFNNLFVFCLFD
jgi:E3 ubiquitin-protein ligase DOA10